MPDIQNLMKAFQTRYHGSKTIEEHQKMTEKFRGVLDDFMFTPTKKDAQVDYVSDVKHFVDQYAKYLNGFDAEFDPTDTFGSVEALVEDYEQIVQLQHEEKGTGERTPYLGTYGAVMDTIKKSLEPHNKPIHEIWANGIKKNTINFEEVEKITDNIFESVKDEDDIDDLDDSRSVKNAVMMHRTMQEVVNSRGRFWRFWIWNWDRDKKEKAY